MILVDTSIWVDHFRGTDPHLATLMTTGLAVLHPMVLGELVMGNLPCRASTLRELSELPSALPAQHSEVLVLVEDQRLFGNGLGFVDAHLLAAAKLDGRLTIWSRDRRLTTAARRLNVRVL